MAGVFAIAGPAPAAVIVVQIVLGALTAVLTLGLASTLMAPLRAAALAGLIVAVEPASVMTANVLLTETSFTALLLASLGCLARYWDTAGRRWLVAAAVPPHPRAAPPADKCVAPGRATAALRARGPSPRRGAPCCGPGFRFSWAVRR